MIGGRNEMSCNSKVQRGLCAQANFIPCHEQPCEKAWVHNLPNGFALESPKALFQNGIWHQGSWHYCRLIRSKPYLLRIVVCAKLLNNTNFGWEYPWFCLVLPSKVFSALPQIDLGSPAVAYQLHIPWFWRQTLKFWELCSQGAKGRSILKREMNFWHF